MSIRTTIEAQLARDAKFVEENDLRTGDFVGDDGVIIREMRGMIVCGECAEVRGG